MVLKVKRNLILIINLILVAICSAQNKTDKPVKALKLESIPSQNTVINDSLVYALGQQLENSIQESKTDIFMEKFQIGRFCHLATYSEFEDIQIREFKKGFIDGFSKGIKSLPQKIVNTTNNGGFYDFINYYYDLENSTYRMLFRLFSEEEGINYHDFQLVFVDGEFYIQDIYIYVTGENLSDTANLIYLMSMPKNLFEKIIFGNNSKEMKHLLNAVTSQKANKNKTALQHLNLIEGNLKHSKIYHVVKILITSVLSDTDYLEAMQDMLKDYKDDPTSYLLSIDYYVMLEKYDKAIEAIEKLEKDTGDSFLNYMKGNIAYTNENYKDAISYFEIVIDEYPTYDTPKFSLINSYTIQSNYTKCVSVLDQIIANKMYTTSELVEFVESKEEDGSNSLLKLEKSEEYKNWKKRQSL